MVLTLPNGSVIPRASFGAGLGLGVGGGTQALPSDQVAVEREAEPAAMSSVSIGGIAGAVAGVFAIAAAAFFFRRAARRRDAARKRGRGVGGRRGGARRGSASSSSGAPRGPHGSASKTPEAWGATAGRPRSVGSRPSSLTLVASPLGGQLDDASGHAYTAEASTAPRPRRAAAAVGPAAAMHGAVSGGVSSVTPAAFASSPGGRQQPLHAARLAGRGLYEAAPADGSKDDGIGEGPLYGLAGAHYVAAEGGLAGARKGGAAARLQASGYAGAVLRAPELQAKHEAGAPRAGGARAQPPLQGAGRWPPRAGEGGGPTLPPTAPASDRALLRRKYRKEFTSLLAGDDTSSGGGWHANADGSSGNLLSSSSRRKRTVRGGFAPAQTAGVAGGFGRGFDGAGADASAGGFEVPNPLR